MSATTSRASIRSRKSKSLKKKQIDPFYDPNKEVRPNCIFCTQPPKKPPLFNILNLPITTSTTSASWQGGTCCIHVREIDVSIDPPELHPDLLADERRRYRRRKFVVRTPSDLERVRERDYRITLKRTLSDDKWERKLGFQRLKDKQRKLMNDVGPAWYQELSYKQMECMDVLGGTIVADLEEGVISRTQRLLTRHGILPSPKNELVLKAMNKCGSNPIIFLTYLYKYTTEVKDECIEPDSPYTINDRLLLSGLTYLALPMTLFDLHFILPPPAEKVTPKPKAKPVVKWPSFTSPYLDPQPICLYNGIQDKNLQGKRLELGRKGDLFTNDLREVECDEDEWSVEEQPVSKEEEEISSTSDPVTVTTNKKTGPRFGMGGIGVKASAFSVAMFENAMRQVGSGMTEETTSVSGTERDSKSGKANQLETKPIEGVKLKLDKKADTKKQKEDEYGEEKEIRSQIPEWEHTKFRLGAGPGAIEVRFDEKDPKPKDNAQRKLVIPKIVITLVPDQPELDYDDYPYVFDENYEYQYDSKKTPDEAGSLNEEPSVQESQATPLPICDCTRARAARGRRHGSLGTDDLYFSPSDILPCPIMTVPALQAAFVGYWSGVRIAPNTFGEDTTSLESTLYETENINVQFQVALEIMANQGNILASLPEVEKLPALRCWLRLYKGFKLTKDIKEKLRMKSLGMWGQAQAHPRSVPKPSLKLRNTHKMNWDCKHWLMNKVNNMFAQYYSNVRKAQVEDSREYWISMCMEYFLNPAEFRNVYFTYLPSREADVLAVRPWDGRVNK